MKKIIKSIMAGLIFLSLSFFGETSQGSEFNFAVLPEIPANQVDKNKSYFDLKLASGDKQVLKVKLKNNSDKPISVGTTINSATTNLNGVVEYGENKIVPDESLTHNLKHLTTLPDKVEIAANSTETLAITLQAPQVPYEGILAGGITFKELKDADALKKEAEEQEEGKGLSIKNEFSYMVALVVRENEKKMLPNVNLIKAFPDQVNARNVIHAQLQNDQPIFINEVKIKTVVTKRGKNKALYEKVQENLQIAPNSRFDFPTPLGGTALEAGKYTMHVQLFGGKHEDGTFKDESDESYRYLWELASDFDITKQEADTLNSTDVDIKKDQTIWYIIAGGVLLAAAVGLMVWLKKGRNKEEHLQESDRE